MIATIAAIAEKKKDSAIEAIIWKPLFNDRSDNYRWERKSSISAIVIAAIVGEWFSNDRYDRCDRCTFFFSAIVGIIWKPDLTFNT